MPGIKDLQKAFGDGGFLPHEPNRRFHIGFARHETLTDDQKRKTLGLFLGFRSQDDQVLFRLKYSGRLTP